MARVFSDGGQMTVGRRTANYTYGLFDVILPEGLEQQEGDGRIVDGYVYRPDDAGTGRAELTFVRADATVDMNAVISDLEPTLDEASERVDGGVFYTREISGVGLAGTVPGVDYDHGDMVEVVVWGKVLDLPHTATRESSDADDPLGVAAQFGGQVLADADALRKQTSALRNQIAAEKARRMKGVGEAKSAAAGAQSAAEGAQATADAAAVDVVPFFAMVEQGTVPTAPTTDPPPAGWSTEEPGWLEGHNLWRSELTTRGDGTFEWSAPSQVRSWTLAGEARGLAEDAALTAVMVNSPQESVVPVRSDGWPYWATNGAKTADVGPSGESVYRGTFVSSSAPEAYFRLTDVVDFKLVWWMRADAPATVSFRMVDTEGVDRVQAVRMWSPDTGEWVNATRVEVPTPDAWTEYSAVVRVTPGTEDVRLVAGGAVLLSDVRLGVFSLMQEQINAEAQARDQELDVRLQEVGDLVTMVQDLQAQMQEETTNAVVFPRQATTLITRTDWESPSGSIDVRATGTWTGRAIVTSVVQRNMDQLKVEIPMPSSTGSRYIPDSAFLSGYNWMEVQYWKNPLVQIKHGPTSNTVDFAVEKSTWTQVTRQTVTLDLAVQDLMVWFTVIWDAANNYSRYGHRIRHSNGTIIAQWGPSSGVGPLTPLGNGVQSRTVSGTAKSLPAGSLFFEVYSTSDYASSRKTRVTTVQATWLQEP